MTSATLLVLPIDREEDVVGARGRAREIAAALGFGVQDQTRIATAVSEIARGMVSHAARGRIEFAFDDGSCPQRLAIAVHGHAGGSATLRAVLEGSGDPLAGDAASTGIVAARRLMDGYRLVQEADDDSIAVHLDKRLPAPLAQAPELPGNLAAASRLGGRFDLLAELRTQNRELVASLAELAMRQEELERLNAEIEDTNRGVVALYAELDERAEALRRASELKSRFLSHMSHEFRTPLTSILALSRLLVDRADGELTPEQERQVNYIRQSAQNLSELVNDLLDLAKVEAGQADVRAASFTVAELFGALRGVFRPLVTGDGVELVFIDADTIPPLESDEGKIAQILRNFISNALKFTERGEVRVWAEHVLEGDRVAFVVRDTGIGIAPEDQERIFQEFAQVDSRLQRKVKGTGLGLPLSSRLAGLLGGEITLASTPELGSTFVLKVPRRFGRAASSDEAGGTMSGAADGRHRILIVDDEEASRYVLRQLIDGERYEVIEAAEGLEGVRLVRANRPDLVLLDLRMPGLDGYEVLQVLRADPATSGIPVVVATSSVLDEVDDRRLSHARGILPKAALTRDLLAGAIEGALRQAERSAVT